MNKKELKEKIKILGQEQEWNHQYELAEGVFTRSSNVDSPGYNTHKWKRLEPIFSDLGIEGKTILDVGSSDGFYAIECAKMGARVMGIEIDKIRVERAEFVKNYLKQDNVEFSSEDLYDFDHEKFDIIMALGLLHRIPDMLTFLGKASQMSDVLVLEYKTFESNEDTIYDGQKETKLNSYNTLHGIPTNVFVQNRLSELGYQNNHFYLDDQSNLKFKRSICVAKRSL